MIIYVINQLVGRYQTIIPRTNVIFKKKSSDNGNLDYILEKSSKEYWEHRYATGGNSGSGSYNHLANFKASVINNFVIKNNVNTVIEWGSGDCNQLSLSNYKNYIGYDISQSAIKMCKNKFSKYKTKTF